MTVGLQSYGVLDQVEDQGLQLGVGEGEEELHPGTDPGNGLDILIFNPFV